MIRFTELRDALMDQHGWSRRVATIAARIYLGVDTSDDLIASATSRFGRLLLSGGEYNEIIKWR